VTDDSWIEDAIGSAIDYSEADLNPEVPVVPKLIPIVPKPGGTGFFQLRPYQEECVDAVYRTWQTYQSCLMIAPTGTGKTCMLAEVVLRWPDDMGRVLVIAHTEELIDQAAEKIGIHLDEATGIEMGERKESIHPGIMGHRPKVVVASIQTLSRPKRRAKLDGQVGLIVYDEAHHSVSKSARAVLTYFLLQNPQLRILGPTATPQRGDKKALGDVYESVAYEMNLVDAIDEGWLVPIEQKIVVIEGLDFSKCRSFGGDLNQDDLATVMMGGSSSVIEATSELTPVQIEQIQQQEKMIHAVVKPTIEESHGRPTVVFCVTKAHARLMCEIFNRYLPFSAEVITDDTPKEDRHLILRKFRSGQFQFLLNCSVLSEGFDSLVDVIVNAAPTKSISRYMQRIGRGTRPLPGIVDKWNTAEERKWAISVSAKPAMSVLDFTGDSGKHNLITAVDVLGGEYEENIIEAAKARLRNGDTADVQDVLEEIEQEIEDEKKKAQMEKEERERLAKERAEAERIKHAAEASRRASVKAEVQYRTQAVGLSGAVVPQQIGIGMRRGGATDSQVKFLIRLGISHEKACEFTKGQAGAVIDKLSQQTGSKYIFRFGKYCGNEIGKCPTGYLSWAAENLNDPDFKRNYQMMVQEKVS
jgi:superfamily II DNA or RNA helicase